MVVGENFGEFGKTNVIRQHFTQPSSRSTKLAKGLKFKFANVFLTKTLETIDLAKFSSATVLHYTVITVVEGSNSHGI